LPLSGEGCRAAETRKPVLVIERVVRAIPGNQACFDYDRSGLFRKVHLEPQCPIRTARQNCRCEILLLSNILYSFHGFSPFFTISGESNEKVASIRVPKADLIDEFMIRNFTH
jgi:hypothetical protein